MFKKFLPALIVLVPLIACINKKKSNNLGVDTSSVIASSSHDTQKNNDDSQKANYSVAAKEVTNHKPGAIDDKNAVSLTKKKSRDSTTFDPAIVKNLLLKKGIYFGDYLGNEDVEQKAPRPKNFMSQIDQYFDLYSIPAWFHHIEYKQAGKYDFGGPDEVANYAVSRGYKMQMQNLVWWNVPAWLKNGHFTPDQLSTILKNHILATVKHFKDKYPGSIVSWDVVNEAISDSPNLDAKNSFPDGLRSTCLWSAIHKPGSNDPLDYVELAFQWAHEADPNVKLYWCEFGTEYKGFKMDRWFTLVKKMINDGVPINGVGFQTHLFTNYDHPTSDLLVNMNRFADLGLYSEVTEMDVIMSSTSPIAAPHYKPMVIENPTDNDFQRQAAVYKGILDDCIKAKKVDAFILFGDWDPVSSANTDYSSKLGIPFVNFYPNILDQNMKPKPAFKAMVDEVKANISQ